MEAPEGVEAVSNPLTAAAEAATQALIEIYEAEDAAEMRLAIAKHRRLRDIARRVHLRQQKETERAAKSPKRNQSNDDDQFDRIR